MANFYQHFRNDFGRKNIRNAWQNKSVFGITLANLGKLSKTRRLNENKRFLSQISIHKNKWTKSKFSAQQWKVKQSKRVKEHLRGRGGGRGDGKLGYVKLYLQMGTSPLFVFSKCK